MKNLDIVSKYNKYGQVENVMQYINHKSLKEAYDTLSIYKNKAPGIDKITIREFGINLDRNIDRIMNNLKSNRYEPNSLRKASIPKNNGKRRIISIPCTTDKIIQVAIIQQILEPITEITFTDESFAFRPNLSLKSAINYLIELDTKYDIQYILGLDIANCFEAINRSKMIEILNNIFKDRKFITLINKIIKTEYYDKSDLEVDKNGIHQGMCISPILVNLYLYEAIDKWYRNISVIDYIYLIRYADDILLLFNNENDMNMAYFLICYRLSLYDLEISKEKIKKIEFSKEKVTYLGIDLLKVNKRIYKYLSDNKINEFKSKMDIFIDDALVKFRDNQYKDKRYKDVKDIQEFINKLNSKLNGIYNTYKDFINNPLVLDDLYKYVIDEISRKFNNVLSENIILEVLKDIVRPNYFEPRKEI